MNSSITDWVDLNNLEQCDFLYRIITKLIANTPGMEGVSGDFHEERKGEFVLRAAMQLGAIGRLDLIKKLKSRWSSKKYDLKIKESLVTHSIKLSKESSSVLKKLTINANLNSIHETIETLILDQYQQLLNDLNEVKERKKRGLIKSNEIKQLKFENTERRKRLGSAYIHILEHNKLKNELEDANRTITALSEKLTSKEKSIDKHLDKISKFIDKIDGLEDSN